MMKESDEVCLDCCDELGIYDYSKWCLPCALALCNDPDADGHAEAMKEYYERAEAYDRTRGGEL